MLLMIAYLTTAIFMGIQQWKVSDCADVIPRICVSALYGALPPLWLLVLGGMTSVADKKRRGAFDRRTHVV